MGYPEDAGLGLEKHMSIDNEAFERLRKDRGGRPEDEAKTLHVCHDTLCAECQLRTTYMPKKYPDESGNVIKVECSMADDIDVEET